MSTTNNAVLFSSARANVEVVGGAAQASAVRLTHALSRCTRTGANFILPSILTGEASEPMILVNDTAGSVNIYPAVGEKTNGSLNTAFAVAAGASAICVPVLNSTLVYPSTFDWRCALIS